MAAIIPNSDDCVDMTTDHELVPVFEELGDVYEQQVCTYGYGAQELVVQEICRRRGYTYLGRFEDWPPKQRRYNTVVWPLAQGKEKARQIWQIVSEGYELATLIHPDATVAGSAVVEGVMIDAGTVVEPKAHIGPGTYIQPNCTIQHDVQIGSCTDLAPGVQTTGGVHIGDYAMLGAGVVIVPNISVGDRATIWAGALVQKNVGEATTFYVLAQRQPFKHE